MRIRRRKRCKTPACWTWIMQRRQYCQTGEESPHTESSMHSLSALHYPAGNWNRKRKYETSHLHLPMLFAFIFMSACQGSSALRALSLGEHAKHISHRSHVCLLASCKIASSQAMQHIYIVFSFLQNHNLTFDFYGMKCKVAGSCGIQCMHMHFKSLISFRLNQ